MLAISADAIAPGPTGSGNRAIRWGLLEGLARAGAVPAFYAAAASGKNAGEFAAARQGLRVATEGFWFDRPATGDKAVASLREAIAQFRPDVILTYGVEPLRLAREAAPQIPTGIMSVDLEHLPILHRHWYNLRYGRPKQKIKSLLHTPKQLLFARNVKRDIDEGYPLADFVINHASHHARWHERAHGRPVLYTPNPIAPLDTKPRRAPAKPPRFVLLGGIGGIATLTGLAFFASRIYPLLEAAIARGGIEIHLIGRGELEPSLDRRMQKIVRRGYVDDIAPDFAAATALLVPTPITLGFRTRIVDSFRHGVTVVAHGANGVGMPELKAGHNALVASTPQGFADAVMSLVADPTLAERLGSNAYADFETNLSSIVVAHRIVAFVRSILGR